MAAFLGSTNSAWRVKHHLLQNEAPTKFNTKQEALRWVKEQNFTLSSVNTEQRIIYYKSSTATP